MINEYISDLRDDSVWTFAKQKVSNIKEIIPLLFLFEKFKEQNELKIDEFFEAHHKEYGVTNVYRSLIIPQMLGFITKNNSSYEKQELTPAYYDLKKCVETGDNDGVNYILSEQLIKLKVPIITNRDNEENYCVLPLILTFKVLYSLYQKGKNSISIDELHTFVFTSKDNDYERISNMIFLNKENLIYKNVDVYKSNSRFSTLFSNCSIFKFSKDYVELDLEKINDFLDFVSNIDIKELESICKCDAYYDFLYTIQGFNVDIIEGKEEQKNKPINNDFPEESYIESLLYEENEEQWKTVSSHLVEPKVTDSKIKQVNRNRAVGKQALRNAKYKCEFNNDHETFVTENTSNQFMEAHHLIPMEYQYEVWLEQGKNIDCVENVVSLCPNCHRAIHYSDKKTKERMLLKLFESRQELLSGIGIVVSWEDIKNMYDL